MKLMNAKLGGLVGLFLIPTFISAQQLENSSSSTSALTIKLKVKTEAEGEGNPNHIPLQLTRLADLDFGDAYPGDPSVCVLPSDVTAAQYRVMGKKNSYFNITLPNGVVLTTNGGKLPEERIIIDRFSSDPGSSKGGLLDSAGTARLNVGACRAAILQNQVMGEYEGEITVTVAY